MKLQNIKKITGKIRVLTGLHIGAGKDAIEIGGLDNPIIKHPLTKAPYVPGSSLKGKIRSLLEITRFIEEPETRDWITGKKDDKGRGLACGCGKEGCSSCTIFGTSAANKSNKLGPTRLIVRDAYLTDEWAKRFNNGELLMETKYENTIDRVKGVADNPRPLERVPQGVEFDLNLSFKVYEGDDEKLLENIFHGLHLVELDALGGCSSRGCGQVQFIDVMCDGEKVDIVDYGRA